MFHTLFPYGLCLNKPNSSCAFPHASTRPRFTLAWFKKGWASPVLAYFSYCCRCPALLNIEHKCWKTRAEAYGMQQQQPCGHRKDVKKGAWKGTGPRGDDRELLFFCTFSYRKVHYAAVWLFQSLCNGVPNQRSLCTYRAVTAEGARKCLLCKPISDRQRDTRTFLFHHCLICSVVRQGTGPVKVPTASASGVDWLQDLYK